MSVKSKSWEPRQTVDANDFRKKQEEARRDSVLNSTNRPSTQKPAVQASALNATTDHKPFSKYLADRLAEFKQSQES